MYVKKCKCLIQYQSLLNLTKLMPDNLFKISLVFNVIYRGKKQIYKLHLVLECTLALKSNIRFNADFILLLI